LNRFQFTGRPKKGIIKSVDQASAPCSLRALIRLFISIPFWMLLICSSCRQGANRVGTGGNTGLANPSGNQRCGDPQKITAIYRENVYDLSGYANGAGDPFNLFDENAYVDPRSDSGPGSGYLPVTDPQPKRRPSIYFQLGRGNRIVTDLEVSYRLTEVYIYDRSRVADSVWIYTGDMQHWKLKAAFLSSTNGPVGGWRKFSLDDSSRYLMICFSSYETAITEMVLYGCPYGAVPPAPAYAYNGARLPKKMMKEPLGVNYVMENELHWLEPFHYSRLYNMALDFDNDTLHAYPSIQYNMLHYGYWDPVKKDYHFNIDDIKKLNGALVWFSIRGVSRWMDKRGFRERDRPVTLQGMDPEDPMSYARHAGMMWQMAAFFGNSKADTNLLSLSHSPRQSGRGTMDIYENGNEEDAVWEGSRYCSPFAYFAQSSADFDGHEGRMGPGHGIFLADSSSRLMTSGLTELDTNRVRTYKFLCDNLRNDKKFVWRGGIQYHHYSTNGKKGLTPEEDSLRWRLSKVRACTYRIEPGVECILGENGYDKNPASPQGAPALPGLSPSQSQGIFILRSINATAFSGFDAYILFWLRDSDPPTSPHIYSSSGILGPGPNGATIAYPAWYYISSFVYQLGNYVADSIVSEQGNAWIYKYRNQFSPDSVAYFIYSPTRNGTKLDAYPVQVGSIVNGEGMQVTFEDKNPRGTIHSLKAVDGVVRLRVEEKPTLLLLKEARR
jgi:hypothetical protein